MFKCAIHRLEMAIPVRFSFQMTTQISLLWGWFCFVLKYWLIAFMVLFLGIFCIISTCICKTIIKIPTCYFMSHLWSFISLKPFLLARLQYIATLQDDSFKVICYYEVMFNLLQLIFVIVLLCLNISPIRIKFKTSELLVCSFVCMLTPVVFLFLFVRGLAKK